jgi:ribulose-5-phosphate 4-epimerase/fuculose-1-phosphate aldolase
MKEEGYIKFNCYREDKEIFLTDSLYNKLDKWRARLFDLSLIGEYNNGIGYGNISVRSKENQFFISGSATGGKPKLFKDDYALVTNYNLKNNSLHCEGKLNASSESLSHAVIYSLNKDVGAVIHIHSDDMWDTYLDKLPTTDKKAAFGTPEIASSILELLQSRNNPSSGILVMGGHKEGIISFGENLEDAGNIILDLFTSL